MSAKDDENFVSVLLEKGFELGNKGIFPEGLVFAWVKLARKNVEVDDDLSFIWNVLELILKPSKLFLSLFLGQRHFLNSPRERIQIKESNSFILCLKVSSFHKRISHSFNI